MPNNLAVSAVHFAATLACFVVTAVVVIGAQDRKTGRIVALGAFTIGMWNAQLSFLTIPSLALEHPSIVSLLRCFGIFLPATVFHGVVALTDSNRLPWAALVWLVYAVAVVNCGLLANGLLVEGLVVYPWGAMSRPGPYYPLFVISVLASFGGSIALVVRTMMSVESPILLLRTRYLLLGIVPAMALGVLNFLPNYGVSVMPLGSVGALVYVAVMAYGALHHRLLEMNALVIRLGAVAFALLAVAVPLTTLVLWAQRRMMGEVLLLPAATSIGSILVGIGAYSWLRRLFCQAIERSLFPARYEARRAIAEFSREVVELTNRDQLGMRLVESLARGLGLVGAALYVRREDGSYGRDAAHGEPASPPSLQAVPECTTGEGAEPDPEWELCVPLGGDDAEVGFIALGPKRSGAAIDDLDTTLLNVVASQVAVALRNIETLRQVERQKDAIAAQKREIEELQARVQAENTVLREEVRSISGFDEILGDSPALGLVRDLVLRVAPSDVSVLITGETGTGKELIARSLHKQSRRAAGPLISVNCPAIPAGVAEAELFGSERGAFTGAVESRIGRFEMAEGGTLFLDEVAELPLEIQAKLLRVLEEREIQRLGSARSRRIDVRVVAATNRNLHAMIQEGRFRSDLFHRLAGMELCVPPLRQRTGDMAILAPHFLERAARLNQKPARALSPTALRILECYSWPGNVRELQNVIERAVLLCDGALIAPEHLGDLSVTHSEETPLALSVRDEKARRIEEALEASGGNQAEAARRLGVAPSNLGRMIRRMGLKTPRSLQ